MTLKERIRVLANERGIGLPVLESELGFGNSTILKWDKSMPSIDKLQKVADYFEVSIDFLLGNSEFRTVEEQLANLSDNSKLNAKDEKDIAKRLDAMLDEFTSPDALMFDGQPLDDETKELLRASLENSLRTTKAIAKQKFTPNKYKK